MNRWPFILSYRDAEDWYEGFSQSIPPLVMDKAPRPAQARPRFEMLEAVIIDKALNRRTDREGTLAAYRANQRAVELLAERGRALSFRAADGWASLYAFRLQANSHFAITKSALPGAACLARIGLTAPPRVLPHRTIQDRFQQCGYDISRLRLTAVKSCTGPSLSIYLIFFRMAANPFQFRFCR